MPLLEKCKKPTLVTTRESPCTTMKTQCSQERKSGFCTRLFSKGFPKAGTPGGHPHALFPFLQPLLLGAQPCPHILTIADNHFLALFFPSMKMQIPGMYIYFQSPSDFFNFRNGRNHAYFDAVYQVTERAVPSLL